MRSKSLEGFERIILRESIFLKRKYYKKLGGVGENRFRVDGKSFMGRVRGSKKFGGK